MCSSSWYVGQNIKRSWSQSVVLVRAPVVQDGSLWVVLVDTISETGNLSTSRSLPHLLDLFLLSDFFSLIVYYYIRFHGGRGRS